MASPSEILSTFGTAVEIAKPLISKIVGLVVASIGAPEEQHAAIVERLIASEKALDDAAAEAHQVHDEELKKTEEVLAATSEHSDG